MSLSAEDILKKTFKLSFKGYDQDAVDTFLDEIIDEFKEHKKEIEALKQENKLLKELITDIKTRM